MSGGAVRSTITRAALVLAAWLCASMALSAGEPSPEPEKSPRPGLIEPGAGPEALPNSIGEAVSLPPSARKSQLPDAAFFGAVEDDAELSKLLELPNPRPKSFDRNLLKMASPQVIGDRSAFVWRVSDLPNPRPKSIDWGMFRVLTPPVAEEQP